MRVSSHVKQQEAAKPCQIGKIVCFLHSKMLPFEKFSGLRPKPRWGLNAPQTPTCKALPFTARYAPAGLTLTRVQKLKLFILLKTEELFRLSRTSFSTSCRVPKALCPWPIRTCCKSSGRLHKYKPAFLVLSRRSYILLSLVSDRMGDIYGYVPVPLRRAEDGSFALTTRQVGIPAKVFVSVLVPLVELSD